ncbi:MULTISPECIES: 2-phospho-L-lactate guanylyltransferase [unclassified Nocardioides]|uniref:2-phospho-L-lactate guanylyltransferase n=1 Tax=unclassified Nocardioides TaxID=2615069 RepID=UPI0009F08230|nr:MULTISPECIES: 2-phospho-L-lactate guanylyltransferase [unclassified Nocardioides]GAW48951.1 2-phospho-L-lactate guanylyltransferase [Nocardioides sp. PD653-B2]GAW55166.1 2-phospho-L-lactate guanylyltransferase [Nocardioides sp. PD653]
MTSVLLVPVKRLTLAKTRLDVPASDRYRVARALMRNTLRTAAHAAGGTSLAVVTADEEVSAFAAGLGAGVVLDTTADLNSALEQGLNELIAADAARSVTVLVADLALLSPADVHWLHREATATSQPKHVSDQAGTGTTAVVLPAGHRVPMVFGPSSAERFRSSGCLPLDGAPLGLRADLDTLTDLRRLGIPAA